MTSETTTEHKQFSITGAKGFHLTFSNGWGISVQFGPGNYSDCQGGRGGSFDGPTTAANGDGIWRASSAEIAVFVPEKLVLDGESCGHMLMLVNDNVAGWVSADSVGKVIGEITAFTPETSRETASAVVGAILDADEE